jgi:hypothetical protein
MVCTGVVGLEGIGPSEGKEVRMEIKKVIFRSLFI